MLFGSFSHGCTLLFVPSHARWADQEGLLRVRDRCSRCLLPRPRPLLLFSDRLAQRANNSSTSPPIRRVPTNIQGSTGPTTLRLSIYNAGPRGHSSAGRARRWQRRGRRFEPGWLHQVRTCSAVYKLSGHVRTLRRDAGFGEPFAKPRLGGPDRVSGRSCKRSDHARFVTGSVGGMSVHTLV